MAEPAPTRRSSRIPSAPAQASSETLGASRAELRRRAAASTAEQPTVVLGTPADEKRKDAAADAPVAVQPLTDLPAAPAPAAIELPATLAPLSRRARRAPVTADAPAPMIETVLTPAEPFELLEPVVAPEASDEPVVLEVVEEPVAEPVAERPVRRQRAPRRPIADAPADEAPVEVEPDVAAPIDEAVRPAQAQDAASAVDAFEAAARLFSFTGEFAVQPAAEAVKATVDGEILGADAGDEKLAAAHKAPRKRRTSRGTAFKRVTAASFSVGVMGIVGLMTVGMTTPAEAVAAASGADASMMSVVAPGDTTSTDISPDEIQAYVAPATVEAETLDRSGSYDTTTVAELAGQAGIRNFSSLFHNDPNAAIQWPFVVGVTMSYGFGMRDGKLHKGIDFTPGAGSPIQAIADGTVRVASEAGGDYGVHVIIDHVIDGQLISSHYAHMQYGSLQVVAGQKVTVGTVLGHTGNTGRSYGAHTHFELLVNGTVPIDPMPWLREHAGG
ncbi:M23 family metallopeptidase [Microbacterium sp. Root180]|uniref:M23 family metallopeptidase n=1 Tax=Microbacterium sp. Root180 TaxID=1736483 RepID=UPI0009EB4965|nr:M23 family metallopeptidase [Microbacterium sp. Root180]